MERGGGGREGERERDTFVPGSEARAAARRYRKVATDDAGRSLVPASSGIRDDPTAAESRRVFVLFLASRRNLVGESCLSERSR